MKKILSTIFIIMITFSLFYGRRNTFGMDAAGCLTCHKYPGLVRLEQSKKIKVLHINEEKYLNSPHGKFGCRDCHTQILKVPHTGVQAVDCATKCHLKEKASIRSKIDPLSDYHLQEQSYITHLRSESACNTCHSIYPHSNNNAVRALLNMHTGFLACEVCHLNRDNLKGFSFDWKEPEEVNFSGEPFGTYYKPKKDSNIRNEHLISRIAVFVIEKSQKKIAIHHQDIKKADQFLAQEKQLSPDEKEERIKFFHRDIARKEISVACNECHSENSILNYRKLGFDEKKTNQLQSLGIKGLVTKYKVFYFPDLFGR